MIPFIQRMGTQMQLAFRRSWKTPCLRGSALAAAMVTCSVMPATHAASPVAGPTPQAIDAAVRATIDRYNLPGIAVGVIEEGKVVFARGYGETVAGSGDPVTSKTLFKTLKSIMISTPLTKLGALAIKGGLKQLMAQVSPDTYGGAPLLGVKGALLVGHGSSSALAVKNGVLTTARIARTGVSDIIAQTVATPCAAEATEGE